MMLRWVVKQPWARKASYYGVHDDEFVVTTAPRVRHEGSRRTCLTSSGSGDGSICCSLAVTIPGLIFILLTLLPGSQSRAAVLDRLHAAAPSGRSTSPTGRRRPLTSKPSWPSRVCPERDARHHARWSAIHPDQDRVDRPAHAGSSVRDADTRAIVVRQPGHERRSIELPG